MIKPELTIAGGDKIMVGSNTFRVMPPNAIKGPPQVDERIESVDRARALVEAQDMPIDVHLIRHGFSAGIDENREGHVARRNGDPNVFVDPPPLLSQVAGLHEHAMKRPEAENTGQ